MPVKLYEVMGNQKSNNNDDGLTGISVILASSHCKLCVNAYSDTKMYIVK